MFTSTLTGEGIAPGGGVGVGYGSGSWGFIIFILFILWFFFDKNKEGYCNQDMRADNIKNTAEIEYNNLLEQRNSRDAIMSQASAIRAEQQAETIFDLKLNAQTNELKNGQLLLAKDGEIRELLALRETDKKFNQVFEMMTAMNCRMLPKPELFGQAAVTTATPVPLTVGFNNGFAC